MREIKFRLRNGNTVVGYERWNSIAGKWCYDTKPDGVFDIRNPFIPHTDKDQYTGLKSKNGKEIYEGDITEEMSRIGWCDKCCSFEFFLVDFGCSACSGDVSWSELVDDKNKKVIGNIYESKELLKVEM